MSSKKNNVFWVDVEVARFWVVLRVRRGARPSMAGGDVEVDRLSPETGDRESLTFKNDAVLRTGGGENDELLDKAGSCLEEEMSPSGT